MSNSWPARAAVIGVGTMGSGFVQLLALARIETRMVDADLKTAVAARDRMLELARRFESSNLFAAGAADRIAERTEAVASIADASAEVDFVLEAVTENPDVKRRVYLEVEAVAPEGVVIATNTSAIPIRVLSEGRRDPSRFLGTHWFNPAQWVPCVEIIPGPETADEIVASVHSLMSRLGKQPVTVGDAAGFVANRIQFAMFKEAASVVADGVATAGQVDEVVKSSFGFRLPFYGPFMIAEMAGLDVYSGAYQALEEGLGERFQAPASVTENAAAGRYGIKTGGAYFDASSDDTETLTERRDHAYQALSELLRQLAEGEVSG